MLSKGLLEPKDWLIRLRLGPGYVTDTKNPWMINVSIHERPYAAEMVASRSEWKNNNGKL